MRMLVDLQGAQSGGSRHRGIGRYSWALIRALARNRGEHQLFVLLNAAFQESAVELRSLLGEYIDPQNVIMFHPVDGAAYAPATPETRFRRIASEHLREAAIEQVRPDVVLISSLFEGLGDTVVTSVRRLGNCPTAVILYDLIPLQFSAHYLSNDSTRAWYFFKLEQLRKSDLLLTISESTRREALRVTGMPEPAVINISTAVEDDFFPSPGPDDEWHRLRREYGVNNRYILYTGGIDFRKNIERLIAAYAGLSHALRKEFQLVIVCAAAPSVKEHYQALASQLGLRQGSVVFTGYVPHAVLLVLYSRCTLFVFPSFSEGFGIPILEAMKCGAVVIGSNTSSIPEVIDFDEALFDPYDIPSISRKIEYGILDEGFRARFADHAAEQVARFSWDRTAKVAIEALTRIAGTRTPLAVKTKPRLALVTPIPPLKSGIAQYAADVLPHIADDYEVTMTCPRIFGPSIS